jgi:hypothetical protein
MDVSTVAASVTALVGVVLGAWLAGRGTRGQWLKETQLGACQKLMDQYAQLYESLAKAACGGRAELVWTPWNQAITAITFVCHPKVVEAAIDLDEQMWRLHRSVAAGLTDRDSWVEDRRPVEDARADFVHTVRRHAADGRGRRVRTSGRPPVDDPLWLVAGPDDVEAAGGVRRSPQTSTK